MRGEEGVDRDGGVHGQAMTTATTGRESRSWDVGFLKKQGWSQRGETDGGSEDNAGAGNRASSERKGGTMLQQLTLAQRQIEQRRTGRIWPSPEEEHRTLQRYSMQTGTSRGRHD